ncbi:putative GTP pyrophosphokinase [Microterricola gilva]|uniref:Putative GTP pyrophosphokinase n=1 Tax=Microterricola gilva TaxID=393267 RepID=A0A4Q8ANH2_9MICO|nr:putative GTP pyrophosphokinase [Microterricola gilva]
MSDRPDALQLPPDLEELSRIRHEFEGLMLRYKFGIDEMMTKLNILKEEFSYRDDYSPIEHVSSRLKSPESILAKAVRKGLEPTVEQIAEHIHDVAGIRVTCSFISDAYRIFDMLTTQADVTVLRVRDYIAQPKKNGYQSLHVLIEVPVFLSQQVHRVKVEVQIRTIAMDFWASLEHKIYYKYDGDVPDSLLGELRDAAATASRLDVTMERLHDDVKALDAGTERYIDPLAVGSLELPDTLLRTFWPADAAPVPAPDELPRPNISEA